MPETLSPDSSSSDRSWVINRSMLKALPVLGSIFNVSEGIYNFKQAVSAYRNDDFTACQMRLQQSALRAALGVNLAVNTLIPNPFLLAAMGYSALNELPLTDIESTIRAAKKNPNILTQSSSVENKPAGLGDYRLTGEALAEQLQDATASKKGKYNVWKALTKGIPIIGGACNISHGVVNLAQMVGAFRRNDAQVASLRFRQAAWHIGLGVENIGYSVPLLLGFAHPANQIFGPLPTGTNTLGAAGLAFYSSACSIGFETLTQSIEHEIDKLEKIPNRVTPEQNRVSLLRMAQTAVKGLPFVGGLVNATHGLINLGGAMRFYVNKDRELGDLKLNQGLMRIALAGYNLAFPNPTEALYYSSLSFNCVDESDAQDIGQRVNHIHSKRKNINSEKPTDSNASRPAMFKMLEPENRLVQVTRNLYNLVTKPYRDPDSAPFTK